jgi:hypothetical protein
MMHWVAVVATLQKQNPTGKENILMPRIQKYLCHILGACSLAVLLLSLTTPVAFAATKNVADAPLHQCIGDLNIPSEDVISRIAVDASSPCQSPALVYSGANVEEVVLGPTAGQTTTVCRQSPIPPNDVIVNAFYSPVFALTSLGIKRFCEPNEDLTITPATGTVMTVCQISPIPKGWEKTTEVSYDQHCLGTGNQTFVSTMIIRKTIPTEPLP